MLSPIGDLGLRQAQLLRIRRNRAADKQFFPESPAMHLMTFFLTKITK